jgi:DUF4097 and DUF4098 domain-containing protein YvlB
MLTKTLVLAAVLAAPALHAQQKLDEKRSAAPDGVVAIENSAGSIKVIGWDRAEITVTGTLGARAEGLDISGTSRRTSISVDARNPHGVRSDLEIHVPTGSRVEIDSFGAAIDVSGVSGPVVADTVNGSISISGSSQEVEASSVNGGVAISGSPKRVRAESVNGSVTVKGASGQLDASTVNGELIVAGATFDHANLETVSGSVEFEGDLAAHATLAVSSVSGNVDLAFPAKVSADFSITTFSGNIENGLSANQPEKTSRWTSQKELTFTLGSGGADVSIETLSGEIVLRKRP